MTGGGLSWCMRHRQFYRSRFAALLVIVAAGPASVGLTALANVAGAQERQGICYSAGHGSASASPWDGYTCGDIDELVLRDLGGDPFWLTLLKALSLTLASGMSSLLTIGMNTLVRIALPNIFYEKRFKTLTGAAGANKHAQAPRPEIIRALTSRVTSNQWAFVAGAAIYALIFTSLFNT